jgi:hypothetical protein
LSDKRPRWITRAAAELRRVEVLFVGSGECVEDIVGGVQADVDGGPTEDRQKGEPEVEVAIVGRHGDTQQHRHERRRKERKTGGDEERTHPRQPRPDLHPAFLGQKSQYRRARLAFERSTYSKKA